MQAKRIIVDTKGAPQLFREVPFYYLQAINLVETHSQVHTQQKFMISQTSLQSPSDIPLSSS